MTKKGDNLGCIVEGAELRLGKMRLKSRNAFSLKLGLLTKDTIKLN